MDQEYNLKNTLKLEHFISFEGIDGSGKTTQIKLLKKHLENKGYEVYELREPGGTVLSERIRDILLDKQYTNMSDRAEMLLYSAARNQLLNEKIIPLLKSGYFILADRFVDSTTAYQGYGRQLDLEMVHQVNLAATYGILPGITFYLEISPALSQQRLKMSSKQVDRLEDQGIEFYERVFEGYRALSQTFAHRMYRLDGSEPVESVQRKIRSIVDKKQE